MRASLLLAAIVALAAPSAGLADPGNGNGHGHGQDHGQGQGHGHGHQRGQDDDDAPAATGFGFDERQAIVQYFSGHPGAAYGGLPPGIAKKLARGKPLPPGIAKKVLPPDLVAVLPPSPYQRVLVGPNVVLLDPGTGLVVDILLNILR